MIMPLLGLLDPSRGAFLWGAWGYTVTKRKSPQKRLQSVSESLRYSFQ